jgi:hypothetical protein
MNFIPLLSFQLFIEELHFFAADYDQAEEIVALLLSLCAWVFRLIILQKLVGGLQSTQRFASLATFSRHRNGQSNT